MNAVAKACNYDIWSFWHIRHLLTQNISQILARSIVMLKLDYCNAILHRSPKSSTAGLRRTIWRVLYFNPRTTEGGGWLPPYRGRGVVTALPRAGGGYRPTRVFFKRHIFSVQIFQKSFRIPLGYSLPHLLVNEFRKHFAPR